MLTCLPLLLCVHGAQLRAQAAPVIKITDARISAAPQASVSEKFRLQTVPNDTARLGYITAVALGRDGDVFVADRSHKVINVYDMNGRFVRRFGQPGVAGELDGPDQIAIAGDSIYVNDMRVISVFTIDGRFVRYITPATQIADPRTGRAAGYYHVQSLAAVPNGLIATLPDPNYAAAKADIRRDTIRLRSVNLTDGSLPFIPVEIVSNDVFSIGRASSGMPAFFEAVPRFAVARAGDIYITDADGTSINVVGLDGKIIRRLVIDVPRRPVTPEDVNTRVAAMSEEFRKVFARMNAGGSESGDTRNPADEMIAGLRKVPPAKSHAVVGRIVTGENGELLVERADLNPLVPSESASNTWMYLTRDNAVRAQFTLPSRFKPTGVSGDRIVGIRTDTGSITTVVQYEIALAPQKASGGAKEPVRTEQSSGTRSLLIAVSVVNEKVVWVSGADGTYVRTLDGGATWHAGQVPGAEKLQFRDVYAVNATTAYLLSIGNGGDSRIYKTTNAGRTWNLQFKGADPKEFYDCMDFWDAKNGIVIGDAIGDKLAFLRTTDGGAHWTHVATDKLPAALPGEGSFAASGTCVIARPGGHAWAVSNNASAARVLHSKDRGWNWSVDTLPLTTRDGTGGESISFIDAKHGVALGGGLSSKPGDFFTAVTTDGGATWTRKTSPPMLRGAWGGLYIPGSKTATAPGIIVAVGPNGATYSRDNGDSWSVIDTNNYWSLGFASRNAGWAVGQSGRITKLSGF
jgi:photosystem II stability/assembly factor-like uncharacterized protein